jgi:hypothetical protein
LGAAELDFWSGFMACAPAIAALTAHKAVKTETRRASLEVESIRDENYSYIGSAEPSYAPALLQSGANWLPSTIVRFQHCLR